MSLPRYQGYKNTGVPWIGEIPAHWSFDSIRRHFKILGGATPASDREDFWDGGVPWATPSDFGSLRRFHLSETSRTISELGLESCAATIVPSGTVLISTRAPIGSVAIAAREMCTNQGCRSLVSIDRCNSEFLAYALSAATEVLNLHGRGTTFLELSASELASFKLAFPPFDEQSGIARFLDRETAKIDALIAEQERLIELLKEKRQAFISHAVTKGLNADAPMKPSGVEWLSNVPASWTVARIGKLFREVAEAGNNDLPILSVSIHDGVSDKEMSEDEMDRKVTRSEDRSKYIRVAPGDLVYNMMRAWQGGFGTVVVDGMVSPSYVVARPRQPLETVFVEHVLRTPMAIEQMRRFSKGVTDFRLRLYWDDFKNLRIALPPPLEAKAIARRIEFENARLGAIVNASERSVATLAERRSALISAAVTGQIDVRG